jgi:ABC-type transport system involved in cytochrome c biogenesis permease subunit
VAGQVMAQASRVLFWFALALYIGATVLYAEQFVLRRHTVGWWARFFTGAGFLCQTASIGLLSASMNTTQLTGANQLMLASWALVLLYFVMEHLIRIRVYGTFLIPVAVVLMAISQLLGGPTSGTTLSAEQLQLLANWRVAFHVALIVFGNAGFFFGSVSAALNVWQENQLKRHVSNIVTRRLPSLATLQTLARRSIGFGLPVYTAGLLLGVLRALDTHIANWWLDPRVMLAGIVWVVYSAYLWVVYRREASARTSSWIAIVGLVLVVALAIIARVPLPLPNSFHTFGS